MKSSVVPLSTAKKVSDVFVTTPKMPTKTQKPKSSKIRAKREIFCYNMEGQIHFRYAKDYYHDSANFYYNCQQLK